VIEPHGAQGRNPVCAAAYVCDGVSPSCPTSCSSDLQCAPDHFCAKDGSCQPRKAQGAACDQALSCKQAGCRVCATAACVDGVCCDASCRGDCDACSASRKQSGRDDGVCGPAKEGTDPRDACSRGPTSCGRDGLCDATGGCRLAAPRGVPCEDGKTCDGLGACVAPPTAVCDGDHTTTSADSTTRRDCTPYKCDPQGGCRKECRSVADCVPPNVCDGEGKCSTVPEDPSDGGCAVSSPRRSRSRGSVAFVLGCLLATIGLMRRRGRR
jgi:hypothetical protein